MMMHEDKRPFLTIIAWPEGSDRSGRVNLLARSTGLDAPTLNVLVGKAPPLTLHQMDPAAAGAGAEDVTRAGGDAFTFTLDDLAHLGPTLKIRDLRLDPNGNIAVDLWAGPSATIRRGRVQILIRAKLSSSETVQTLPHGSVLNPHLMRARTPAERAILSYGVGGAAGLAIGLAAGYVGGGDSGSERRLFTSDKLDIHTSDGSVFQVDGDRFAYGVLGDLKGHSDGVNMDRLCDLLAHICPDEIVDPYFPLWKPPPGHHRLRIPHMRRNNDDPGFAFYSRWAALLYRHLLGGSHRSTPDPGEPE